MTGEVKRMVVLGYNTYLFLSKKDVLCRELNHID